MTRIYVATGVRALDLVRSGHVDAVQVIYNAFHQAPEEHLLPACAEHGVGVIVRVALEHRWERNFYES